MRSRLAQQFRRVDLTRLITHHRRADPQETFVATNPADQAMDDAELARSVVDAGRYLVLATADADGRPWPAPVWYAWQGPEFVWVSWPEARHSNNIESRSTVSFVIFEAPVPVEGRTRAIYAEATAAEVSDDDRERCLRIFDSRARAEGLGAWTTERVTAPGNLRLYHAVVSRLFVLHPERDLRREVAIDL
jgi:nitroimidazol reductase NimA-like FMN-containing flavoprotein (pyridoxamine 5'-phosphate oxidase superfamily)